ncbi:MULTISPECIES: 8-amino-7-oxononanoate synthase [unclassified Ensifer]|uniref:8-amino-7-oxononanoate synthase n=1 Tax=unclassified Ensifer TaxID=2633371 RepID=UPI000812F09C|nr:MULTISPECIES: 8-amino-7-oxononanoate synthase [unclassified Ensifer]OCO99972.1 8-amino-7-oxononanoate synthase [Ensifer sp. LC13]OCP00091.1 8-amino-7-oxononanoate synthase [Ensifer sp. LC11]OCP04058.1 8-amino-7-oxononanoate synthase [Ensifer sp. LC14]OCP30979.1 8-amino-7-oxononanoate synthase [Ensifer sp. LC499]
MTASLFSHYEKTLHGLDRKGRRRALIAASGIDFTSNDYLAIAGSLRLKAATAAAIGRGVPVGSGGSRLLRGNHAEHEMLEAEAAAFFGAERALFFGSGYAANAALFSTLPQRDDIIVHDALIHASAHEGIAASRARALAVAHNDVDAFDDAICKWRGSGGTGHPWIAVESLYSMDGDRAPLPALAALADRHDGFLVVDEAHATGVFGPDGRGLTAALEGRDNVVMLHTCGKALGVSGAFVCASAVLCDYLVNRARSFIYSTAPSPLIAAAVREALAMVADEPERRAEFDRLRAFANRMLAEVLGFEGSGSQILPVLVGDNDRAVRIAARLRTEGFDLRAIRPPTVPEGTARLRVAITLNVDEAMIARMLQRLKIAMAEERS